MVVMAPPATDNGSRPLNASEPVPVQALIAELAAQDLCEGVLSQFANLDKAQFDGSPFAPKKHCMVGELRAVVADNSIGQAKSPLELIEKTRRLGAGDGELHQLAGRFPRVVILYAEYLEVPAAGQPIEQEAH